ncbi:MAG: hypothetical protein RR859_08275 [Ruthenibacterium sp.]
MKKNKFELSVEVTEKIRTLMEKMRLSEPELAFENAAGRCPCGGTCEGGCRGTCEYESLKSNCVLMF